ncbi:hypothetical protein NP233_g2772 [Leucocoprinus birnbaumii]|uniref:F-box domain-containing protein n=1 Tax=Leucocoprinus birnbaumii TaxID=56174 RepID=A0AAD5W0S2_9AGAR|nr:hypothetical protein NP233_g2772 [Leucocoprinus birnbaumii]
MSSTTLSFISLPTELWFHSFTFLGTNDFRHLCLVSKTLLPEGRRLLYRDVALRGGTGIMRWTETILSSEILRPLIVSLTLPTRAQLTGYYSRSLTKCLSLLPHLVELNIRHNMTLFSTSAYIIPEILDACSTRLAILRHDLSDVGLNHSLFDPSGFFETHKDLESLYLACTHIGDFLPPHLEEVPVGTLPQLSTLHVENINILRAFRMKPIRRLRVGDIGTDVEGLRFVLDSFRDTLTSLCIGVHNLSDSGRDEDQSLVALMELLVAHVPKLSRLYIFNGVTELDSLMQSQPSRFYSSLQTLSSLKSLVFGVNTRRHQVGLLNPLCNAFKVFVSRLFMSSRSLEQASVGFLPPVGLKRGSEKLFGGESVSFVRAGDKDGDDGLFSREIECTLAADSWTLA